MARPAPLRLLAAAAVAAALAFAVGIARHPNATAGATAAEPASTRDLHARPTGIVVQDPASGLAVSATTGQRSVRVLYLRGPSMVLMREVFLPPGEAVTRVAAAGDGRGFVIESGAHRYALDLASYQLAALPALTQDVAALRRPGTLR